MIKITNIYSEGKMKWPENPFEEICVEPSHDDFGAEEAYNHDWGIVAEKLVYAVHPPSLMQMGDGPFEFRNFPGKFLENNGGYILKKFGGIIKFPIVCEHETPG